jgi:uncharacterized Zn finger protein
MCKHVAAVLYGIGARLDRQPELLFTLRKVDQQELIATVGSDLSTKGKRPAGTKVLASDDLSEMFGIEIAPATPAKRAAARTVVTKPSTAASAEASSKQTRVTRPAKLTTPAVKRGARKPLTMANRQALSARMKEYWAARRASRKKRKAL